MLVCCVVCVMGVFFVVCVFFLCVDGVVVIDVDVVVFDFKCVEC